MNSVSTQCYLVFCRAIADYHFFDDVDRIVDNPYPEYSRDGMLYAKSWIDNVQWHLEDLIRDPDIDSRVGMMIKRRIDRLNQQRTDMVEALDDHIMGPYKEVIPDSNARCNTESAGWAIDRLSILCLKEYHVEAELRRADASPEHLRHCTGRKEILLRQKAYLMRSIDELIRDISGGKAIAQVYKQMKMYNDQELNPVLYGKVSPVDAKL